MNRRLITLIIFACCFIVNAVAATPAMFSDGMVLQRGIPVPIWGGAPEGTEVEVRFASQHHLTKADSSGKWMIKLDPLKASKINSEMLIKVGGKTKIIKNVLVGEVWFCSGQSNMQRPLLSTSVPTEAPDSIPVTQAIREEIESAKDPLLRQIDVPRGASLINKHTNFEGAWIESNPSNNGAFTTVGYYFAKEIRQKLGVPVGLIKCAYGGSKIQPWIPEEGFQGHEQVQNYYQDAMRKAIEAGKRWKDIDDFNKQLKKEEKDPAKLENLLKKHRGKRPFNSNKNPSSIFNKMVHPIVPFGIKGVIWYQGESNTKNQEEEYALYLEGLIRSWRNVWNQGDFPFYYAQLANYKPSQSDPVERDAWATLSNQQRLALKINNTGMAVLNDIGDETNVHPANKIDVGKRLSLWALAKDYGFTDLVYSGPLFKEGVFDGSLVTLTFDSVGKGLMVGKKHLLEPTQKIDASLKGFQICGKHRKWQWAEAKIISKDRVQLSHPDISEPVEVRYAWASNPANANLYNVSGLPTSVFRCVK